MNKQQITQALVAELEHLTEAQITRLLNRARRTNAHWYAGNLPEGMAALLTRESPEELINYPVTTENLGLAYEETGTYSEYKKVGSITLNGQTCPIDAETLEIYTLADGQTGLVRYEALFVVEDYLEGRDNLLKIIMKNLGENLRNG